MVTIRLKYESHEHNDFPSQATTFDVDIQPVDDSPAILWDHSRFIDGDVIMAIEEDSLEMFGSRLSIEDVDCGLDIVSFNMKSSFGSICFSGDSQPLSQDHDVNWPTDNNCTKKDEPVYFKGTL